MISIKQQARHASGCNFRRPLGGKAASTPGDLGRMLPGVMPASDDRRRTPDGTASAEPFHAPPFSVRALAKRWSCSEGAVRSLIRHGSLRHFRVGELIRVRAEEVESYECRN